MNQVNRMISGFFWIALFLAVVLLPVCLLLVAPTPSGRPFWLEFSLALGFFGMTQIAVQFVLIARFKSLTAPYGIDVILQLHRHLALVALAVILLHPLIILIDNPSRLKLLNPLSGNWASRFALVSVLCLLILAGTSLFREKLKLNYEYWRFSHLVFAVLAIVSAQLHVFLAGLYTNSWWKQAIWITATSAMLALVLHLRLIKPAWQRGRQPWHISEVRPERGETWTLVLEADRHAGMEFLPGQFAWLKLGGAFTLKEHPFSFSSSAGSRTRLEFGIKALGDFTSTIKDVEPGTAAYLDGPHGAFCIDRYPAVGYVFIAGGIGITPMLSFLRSMADRKDPRPILLFYADRNWEDLAFREELELLKNRLDLNLVFVLEEPPDDWQGEQGKINSEILERHLPEELIHRNFFVCGPAPMMNAVQDALLEFGVSKTSIHLERFNLA
ncbi:ferredoxin reductase family protein [Geoalkalibacter halelectricus]|uniref:Ferredoxin reductase family protein n=1 Tax=Geoalkalibacter halelectricus TaxID=2847045 RepID=A0ABY5ZLL5_9BACT|nr:ferredoxin reductase family protein [Geoalkalibacter halelectricus]MDO3377218.1 ferredoxin reductase family protein [Geoalkalibacter halelectricus]UWZ79349.1 ferredoxin reductase family protein [Geoalkalibacter halelectricus]